MTDFATWLEGFTDVEEDHVFLPVGAQHPNLTKLMNERADLLTPSPIPEAAPDDERSLGESYADRRDALDARIEELIEEHHPDAPRIRIRALSDGDLEDIAEDQAKWAKGMAKNKVEVTREKAVADTSCRMIAKAIVARDDSPQWTVADVQLLRRKINRGEWGRLLDHVSRLTDAHAEQVTDFPNF